MEQSHSAEVTTLSNTAASDYVNFEQDVIPMQKRLSKDFLLNEVINASYPPQPPGKRQKLTRPTFEKCERFYEYFQDVTCVQREKTVLAKLERIQQSLQQSQQIPDLHARISLVPQAGPKNFKPTLTPEQEVPEVDAAIDPKCEYKAEQSEQAANVSLFSEVPITALQPPSRPSVSPELVSLCSKQILRGGEAKTHFYRFAAPKVAEFVKNQTKIANLNFYADDDYRYLHRCIAAYLQNCVEFVDIRAEMGGKCKIFQVAVAFVESFWDRQKLPHLVKTCRLPMLVYSRDRVDCGSFKHNKLELPHFEPAGTLQKKLNKHSLDPTEQLISKLQHMRNNKIAILFLYVLTLEDGLTSQQIVKSGNLLLKTPQFAHLIKLLLKPADVDPILKSVSRITLSGNKIRETLVFELQMWSFSPEIRVEEVSCFLEEILEP